MQDLTRSLPRPGEVGSRVIATLADGAGEAPGAPRFLMLPLRG